MNLVNKILCYLKCDPGKGILIQKNDNLEIVGHSDADRARCSTTGYCTTIDGNLMI